MSDDIVGKRTKIKILAFSLAIFLAMNFVTFDFISTKDMTDGYYHPDSGRIWVDPDLSEDRSERVLYHEMKHEDFFNSLQWYGDLMGVLSYFLSLGALYMVFSVLHCLLFGKKINLPLTTTGMGILILMHSIPEYHAYILTFLKYRSLDSINLSFYIFMPIFAMFFLHGFDCRRGDSERFNDVHYGDVWP